MSLTKVILNNQIVSPTSTKTFNFTAYMGEASIGIDSFIVYSTTHSTYSNQIRALKNGTYITLYTQTEGWLKEDYKVWYIEGWSETEAYATWFTENAAIGPIHNLTSMVPTYLNSKGFGNTASTSCTRGYNTEHFNNIYIKTLDRPFNSAPSSNPNPKYIFSSDSPLLELLPCEYNESGRSFEEISPLSCKLPDENAYGHFGVRICGEDTYWGVKPSSNSRYNISSDYFNGIPPTGVAVRNLLHKSLTLILKNSPKPNTEDTSVPENYRAPYIINKSFKFQRSTNEGRNFDIASGQGGYNAQRMLLRYNSTKECCEYRINYISDKVPTSDGSWNLINYGPGVYVGLTAKGGNGYMSEGQDRFAGAGGSGAASLITYIDLKALYERSQSTRTDVNLYGASQLHYIPYIEIYQSSDSYYGMVEIGVCYSSDPSTKLLSQYTHSTPFYYLQKGLDALSSGRQDVSSYFPDQRQYNILGEGYETVHDRAYKCIYTVCITNGQNGGDSNLPAGTGNSGDSYNPGSGSLKLYWNLFQTLVDGQPLTPFYVGVNKSNPPTYAELKQASTLAYYGQGATTYPGNASFPDGCGGGGGASLFSCRQGKSVASSADSATLIGLGGGGHGLDQSSEAEASLLKGCHGGIIFFAVDTEL